MRNLFYIGCFIFLFVGCKNKPIEKPMYELTIDSLQKTNISETLEEENVDNYFIQISLKNNSNDTLKFWTMSCSWSANFIFDSNSIYFCPWDCNKNIPKCYLLKQNDIQTWRASVDVNKGYDKSQKIKVGFILMRGESMNCQNMKLDTIWSEPIKFD